MYCGSQGDILRGQVHFCFHHKRLHCIHRKQNNNVGVKQGSHHTFTPLKKMEYSIVNIFGHIHCVYIMSSHLYNALLLFCTQFLYICRFPCTVPEISPHTIPPIHFHCPSSPCPSFMLAVPLLFLCPFSPSYCEVLMP